MATAANTLHNEPKMQYTSLKSYTWTNKRDVTMEMVPFKLLKQKISIVTVNGQLKVNNTYDDFLDLLRLMLRSVSVDEAWYLAQYPDIAEAVAAGELKSAKHHFVQSGYFEGRLPGPLVVDEAWYLAQYPDVADGVARGEILSAQQHFEEYGYDEGRLPAPFPA